MNLQQLAALLDQLKRPIENPPTSPMAPRILACDRRGAWHILGDFEFSSVQGWCGYTPGNDRIDFITHFLPLPKRGECEFEIVPKGMIQEDDGA